MPFFEILHVNLKIHKKNFLVKSHLSDGETDRVGEGSGVSEPYTSSWFTTRPARQPPKLHFFGWFKPIVHGIDPSLVSQVFAACLHF